MGRLRAAKNQLAIPPQQVPRQWLSSIPRDSEFVRNALESDALYIHEFGFGALFPDALHRALDGLGFQGP